MRRITSIAMFLFLLLLPLVAQAHYRVNSKNPVVVIVNTGNLDAERALGVALGLALTDGGANGSVTISFSYTATLASNPALASGHCLWAATGWICEGLTANDYETLFTITDPTADRTINFPNASGNVLMDGSQNGGTDVTADLEEEGQIKGTAVADDAGSAEILVGSGTAAAAWVPVSGDATIATGGAVTVSHATAADGLASNPADCTGGQFADTIAANGNLTCATPAIGRLTPQAAPPAACDGTTEGTMYYDTSGAVCACVLVSASLGWNKILGDGTCS
jgi:hypothetical protein